MSYKVYILKSLANDRYYIGSTIDIEKRLKQHNQGRVRSTKGYKPWTLVYKEALPNRQEAYSREKQIKSYKRGNAFNKLISASSSKP